MHDVSTLFDKMGVILCKVYIYIYIYIYIYVFSI